MSTLCDSCTFLDAHGVDVEAIGCMTCGGGISAGQKAWDFPVRKSHKPPYKPKKRKPRLRLVMAMERKELGDE